ncbi:hypothetical protein D0N36_07475 [Hymenobacter lapidiphilus]|uniref:hypothetical protein n=1 Tax=Hymenobacter sp. CCM 8763 TaxID=2303334 RepID=UPI000E356255|nr:hypothetical protein [Hymenobacter sp. CCM 8763]RFP65762.1 hypothetical protein D0N36_07475 [Hymenobacter sp. CCM 8763]
MRRFFTILLNSALFRLLSLGLLLSLGCLTATAQDFHSPDDANFKQKLRSRYLHNDTAQAIINLFYGKRQAGGASWILSSALAATRIATASGHTLGRGPYAVQQEGPGPGPGLGGALLAAAPFVGYGATKLAVFSNRKLEQVLAGYAAGQYLPAPLRRKLKHRFFNQSIMPYVPVQAVPTR